MNFYEQKLKFNPTLQGLIKIRLTILKNGQVGPVEITHDSVDSPDLTKFIENQLKKWEFGRLSRNETVDLIFPFVPA